MPINETVTVLRRTEAGTDAMGEPVWEWSPEEVGGVSVRPLEARDPGGRQRPDGYVQSYSLAFPKSYAGSLAHCRVILSGRGGDEEYDVVGDVGKTVPSPLEWDRIVEIRRRYG